MFRTKKSRRILIPIIGAALLLGTGTIRPASGQETDPFYRKTLESGEASYSAKSYEEAVRNLEIAVFGLAKEKKLQARGYVYLALSWRALRDKEKSANHLSSAVALIGWDEIQSLALPEDARSELKKLMAEARRDPAAAPPPTPAAAPTRAVEAPPLPKTQPAAIAATEKIAPAETPVARLREAIKTDPRDPSAYYELAAFYQKIPDAANARKTLETLLAQNPAEIRGHLEIGRLEYAARNLKSAEKSLEKFLALTENIRVENRLRDEGRALLLLSAWLRGDAKKTAKLLPLSEDLFQPERFDGLSLDAPDKDRLRTLRDARKK